MTSVNELIFEFESSIASMIRLVANVKKMGKAKFTPPLLQSRIQSRNQSWALCVSLDAKINHSVPASEKKNYDYFKGKVNVEAESTYWDLLDFLTQALADRQPASNTNAPPIGDVSIHEPSQTRLLPLTPIPMPTFSGDYTEWISFRDQFTALVIKRDGLADVHRLHYLKLAVQGEASSLLKNVKLEDANFTTAWESLKKHYDNSRYIIDAHLAKLFDVPAAKTESMINLKRLRDTTREAVSALDNLDRLVETWDDLLVFMTVQKFDPQSRREWEMQLGNKDDYPTYDDVIDFLDYRIRALECIPSQASHSSDKQMTSKRSSGQHVKSHLSTTPQCCDCGEAHSLYKCEQFAAKTIDQRQRLVRENRLCFNCLIPNHKPAQCPSKFTCRICKQKHHTLLHNAARHKKGKGDASTMSSPPTGSPSKNQTGDSTAPQPSGSQSKPASLPTSIETLHAFEPQSAPCAVMLATAWVLIVASNGRGVKVRALLDQGSQSSFITDSIAQVLRAPRIKVRAPISGIGGSAAGVGRALVKLTLKPCKGNGPSVHCNALVFQKLTSYLPRRTSCATSWDYLNDLELADPDPSSAVPIHLILGAEIYANIIQEGLRRGPPGCPIAQRTALGWVLSGPTNSGDTHVTGTLSAHVASHDNLLLCELRKFWELEEIPSSSHLSDEEKRCEAHFAKTHQRLPDGRYSVRLPFKEPLPIQIGSSNRIATNWLLRLEKRFQRDPELFTPYREFMDEYLALNHMTQTTFEAPESNPAVFLPHHPVLKDSSTTRLRVVFNASSHTSNGTSLNHHLMVGPKLQADLPATILRWRVHQFAFTADITKMYRQINVHPEDTRYQQILWRSSPSETITPYQLTTVTYGTAAAPYLAMRVLKQLAEDEKSNFPLAATIVRECFYVDDVLFGANDVNTVRMLRAELEQLLSRGGFTLRKWMASHHCLLEPIPISDQEKTKRRLFDSTESIKILGIGWVPASDSFCYNVSLPKTLKITKRSILSVTAKLYDPLGWLSPIIVAAKILLQELWIAAAGWDDPVPSALEKKWISYCSQIPEIQTIKIPRWNHLESRENHCQIHGFADASTRAYAAVVFLRVVDKNKETRVSLIIAKSKVAPIKTISVPRLELCAAVLLARLIEYVQSTMNLSHCTTYAWTDSTVVLAWLRQHPSTWPTFVANRVSTIQLSLPHVTWRHVPTSENPADCASRGLTATELIDHSLWWKGPSWLYTLENTWPKETAVPVARETLCETTETRSHIANLSAQKWELYNDISSWSKLARVTAYCMRIAAQCRGNNNATDLHLSTDEIIAAKYYWIRVVQADTFPDEIRALRSQSPIPRKSPLRLLTPFIDEHQIIRVGGRLERSSASYNAKHPIILPRHRLSTLIVEDAHARALHGGPQLTISIIRQNFWILGHRSFVRQIIRNCIKCARQRALVPQQLMGNLPVARVSQTRPFLHTGLDYAGPFQVRTGKGRGIKSHKAYLALFVCLSTRAIHLELVSDYTSEAFLAAYRRFVSRRGPPSDMYSDNGTTFQGADRELQQAYRKVLKDTDVVNLIASDHVTWHFIPPGAPHFGGLWEAGVKCTKHHLRRVIGTRTLTFEELSTLFAQIEACLNSRPIGPMDADPCEFEALTPGHF